MPPGMWDPPGPEIEPMSPALAGSLSTTRPPLEHILKGSPKNNFFKINCHALLIFHLKNIGSFLNDLILLIFFYFKKSDGFSAKIKSLVERGLK